MPNTVLIDSGGLIALFYNSDHYHLKAVEFIKINRAKLITSLAVITEVCYLLDFSIEAQLDFLTWVKKGAIKIENLLIDDLDRLIESSRKYSDLPMDFADATLVVLGERFNIKHIATIDSDFYVYRFKNKQSFENVFLQA
jgi:uncharacterized protein